MSLQLFRRFQVTFTSLSDATALIQTIQGYCVCTPARGNGNQQLASMPPPPVVPTTACSPRFPSTVTNQGMNLSYEKSSEHAMSHPNVSPSAQRAASSVIVTADSELSLAHAPSAQPLQSHHNFSLVNSVYPLESQVLLPSTGQTQASQLPLQTSNVAFQVIPHDSEPSSPASSLPPAPWSDPHRLSSTSPGVPSTNPIGPTIVSVAKLYQLPIEELESAVADILREPGFEEFVRIYLNRGGHIQILMHAQVGKLDKMWALHGFMRQ